MVIYSTEENFEHVIFQYDQKRNLYRLVEDYYLEYGPANMRSRLFMQAGFEWDLASVPRIFWPIARPDGPWVTAAMFHDRLYRDKFKFTPKEFTFETKNVETGEWQFDSSRWKRSDADELLRKVGIMGGANPLMAQVYENAVAWWPGNWWK